MPFSYIDALNSLRGKINTKRQTNGLKSSKSLLDCLKIFPDKACVICCQEFVPVEKMPMSSKNKANAGKCVGYLSCGHANLCKRCYDTMDKRPDQKLDGDAVRPSRTRASADIPRYHVTVNDPSIFVLR